MSDQEPRDIIAELREELEARTAEVEHWVLRYRELDAWRAQTSVLHLKAEAEVKRLREGQRSPVASDEAPTNADGPNLEVLLELNGPEHPVKRVAAFLRHDAMMQRKSPSGRWDIPETMARAYEQAARLLDAHMERLAGPGASDVEGWQPIETAPKDEDVLVIHCGTGDEPVFRTIASWCDGRWESGGGFPIRPVAWQPLPNLPAGVGSPVQPSGASDVETKYRELLLAVGKKHQGETRHQTALRYIQQAEEITGDACGSPVRTETP